MIFALHISDGYLSLPWIVGGLGLAVVLGWIGSLRIREAEIPLVAIATAALYIAGLIHVPAPPTSVHLLLNGLVGILLGWRAALAIPVALLLQAVLHGHGGFLALGANASILVLPALASSWLFRVLNSVPWSRHSWWRSSLTAAAGVLWTVSLFLALSLVLTEWREPPQAGDAPNPKVEASETSDRASHQAEVARLRRLGAIKTAFSAEWTWLAAIAAAGALVIFERRIETAPEFPLGLLLGMFSVLLTIALDFLVLVCGGDFYFPMGPEIFAFAHLPVAVIEGVILGFTLSFLAKVKPQLLTVAGTSFSPEPAATADGEGVGRPPSPLAPG